MRRIIGTIGATLAIAAVVGGLPDPKDIPLGDGVDMAALEQQDPPTMTLQEAVEVVAYGDGFFVENEDAQIAEFPTQADEQRNQFVRLGVDNEAIDKNAPS